MTFQTLSIHFSSCLNILFTNLGFSIILFRNLFFTNNKHLFMSVNIHLQHFNSCMVPLYGCNIISTVFHQNIYAVSSFSIRKQHSDTHAYTNVLMKVFYYSHRILSQIWNYGAKEDGHLKTYHNNKLLYLSSTHPILSFLLPSVI